MRLIGRETLVAVALLAVLVAVNLSLNPARFAPRAWGPLIGLAAPLLCASVASMPSMLGGRGGIDVSIGPMIGFINAVIIETLVVGAGIANPWAIVPAALLLGAAFGAVNGALATVVRVQPIIATLGTYLVLAGATLALLPAPLGGAPMWLKSLSGDWSVLPLVLLALAWGGFTLTPLYDHLMATGSDDRAAYSAGVPVTVARFVSYVLGGVGAGVAALMLTALIGSADPTIGPTYTLLAISAAALGGVSLAGGRGGLLAALVGGADIFLLQSALTYFNVSAFVLQIAFGLILVGAICINALPGALPQRRKA
ncbi:MAG: ABC transporter permease [Acetobacteraceae bacterium]